MAEPKKAPVADGPVPGRDDTTNFKNTSTSHCVECQSVIKAAVATLGGRLNQDNSAMVRCPAHNDRNPSLHITPGDDGLLLVHCLAGCSQEAVIEALKDRDLWPHRKGSNNSSDLPLGIPGKWRGAEYTAHWVYPDHQGQILGYVVRYDDSGDKQVIPFFTSDGARWRAGAAPRPRPLYNLHLLSRHQGKPVLVVEGEKAADAAQRLLPGYVCTTWPGGSNAVGMIDFKPLAGRDVTIWPDADEPGFKAARSVAEQCRNGGAKFVNTVTPPDGVKDGWDLADAEVEGWTGEQVRQWIEQASTKDGPEQQRIVPVSIADFLALDFPPRSNILNPWLPTQGITMVYAYRGIGKTFFALSVVYAATSGGGFLGWTAPAPAGVLYIDGEMPAPVMQERLSQIVAGANQEPKAPFILLTPDLQPEGMPRIDDPAGQASIESVLTSEIKLIVIDNVSTLTAAKENEADGWTPVQAWALKQRRMGRSVLFVHHAGKGGAQRGTSRREDTLDTVLALKRPVDYCADQGAVFEIHFEKARGLYGRDVEPIEARLSEAGPGLSWDWRLVEASTFDRVIGLLREGLTQKEIADELQLNKSTVSRHSQRAKSEGHI